jgi:hypothetical protein
MRKTRGLSVGGVGYINFFYTPMVGVVFTTVNKPGGFAWFATQLLQVLFPKRKWLILSVTPRVLRSIPNTYNKQLLINNLVTSKGGV